MTDDLRGRAARVSGRSTYYVKRTSCDGLRSVAIREAHDLSEGDEEVGTAIGRTGKRHAPTVGAVVSLQGCFRVDEGSP